MGLYHYDMGPGVEAFSTERGAVLPFPVIQAHQVHGDKVARVFLDGAELRAAVCAPGDDAVAFAGSASSGACWGTVSADSARSIPPVLEGIDALITDVPGTAIGARTADCIPVLLHDPVHHAVAAIHAGWRGTVARIPAKALAAMTTSYGTDPSDVLAVVGPGIGPESFQVGKEVADAFEAAGFDMAQILHDEGPVSAVGCGAGRLVPAGAGISASALRPMSGEVVPPRSMKGGLHIDLWRANELTLIAAGIPSGNITVAGIDTYTDGRFYSARRETIACPRIINAIVLR